MIAGRADGMTRALCVGVTLLLLGLLGRVAQLQVAPGEAVAMRVQKRESARSLAAPRGALMDRRGRPLATTRFAYQVVIDPTRLPDPPDAAIVALAGAMGMPAEALGGAVMERLVENDERREARARMGLDAPAPQPEVGVLDLVKRRLGMTPPPTPEEVLGPVVVVNEGEPRPPRLARYVPVGPMIEVEAADAVRALRLPGVWAERRPVREYPGGEVVASLVGKVGYADRSLELAGLLGAERTLEGQLNGQDGRLRYVRDARGRPLWIERGDWTEPSPGEPVRLSIDVELQRIAMEELQRGVEDADALGGRIVVLDPATGEVLAMGDLYREVPGLADFPWVMKDPKTGELTKPLGDLPADPRDRPRYRFLKPDPGRAIHPALGRNRCVEDVYEPGSTFKTIVWAAAKEAGVLSDDEVIETGGKHWLTPYGRRITDVYPKDRLTWDEVLLHSSNIGMAQLAERTDHGVVRRALARFGFGSTTGLGLAGETAGLVTGAKNWSKYTQTSVAMGYEVGVTPVQMARAFCAFAREGELAGTVPSLRLTAAGEDGREGLTGVPVILERVASPAVAERVRRVLAGVAQNMDDRMQRRFGEEAEPGYVMFGKSGTSEVSLQAPPNTKRPAGFNGYLKNQHQSSFLAGAPLEQPRLVVLVVIDDPGPTLVRNQQHYGSWTAGPVVRRVVERSLRYLGVPPDAKADGAMVAVGG